jgi:hypothetical protein
VPKELTGVSFPERGEAPLKRIFPLPFTNPQGKGVRGIGYTINPKQKRGISAPLLNYN